MPDQRPKGIPRCGGRRCLVAGTTRRVVRRQPVVPSFALVAAGPATWYGWPEQAFPDGLLLLMAGAVLIAGGAALAIAGALKHGPGLQALPYPRDGGSALHTGPYRIVRHPIYSGAVFMAFGWAIWRQGWLTLAYAALLCLLFDAKARREERWLVEKFPSSPATSVASANSSRSSTDRRWLAPGNARPLKDAHRPRICPGSLSSFLLTTRRRIFASSRLRRSAHGIVRRRAASIEVVVADDGSTDATAGIARARVSRTVAAGARRIARSRNAGAGGPRQHPGVR